MSSDISETLGLDLALNVEQDLAGAEETERIFRVGHCGNCPGNSRVGRLEQRQGCECTGTLVHC